ncbi:MAG TPA: hypothetical protein PKJ33_03870 [Alphaproteobacteria bacterium]|nr:hypothetical protein [Alphaproteobacteria bacterium]
MRSAVVSILAIFACIPAFADVRLPVVNVAAGSVSARAAFGEPDVVQVSPLMVTTKTATAKATAVTPRPASVDSGEKIIAARSDVLTPRKPSGDLWAKSETPLRLPEKNEFAVVRSDVELPEEDIQPKIVARSESNSIDKKEMDNQIAKLVELQRKADESISIAAARPTKISSYDIKQNIPVAKDNDDSDVTLSRVVVPMDDDKDVVVRKVKSEEQPTYASLDGDFSKMSPGELKKAFKKTYLSENKHLSTYKIDDRFDVASDLSTSVEGFTATKDLSESGGIRPLEIKIGFKDDDSSLSRDNYNLLSEYASIVVSNPKRAIQVSIPERSTRSLDDRKLAARRLAIVEQVLRDTGVSEQRIMPVLSQRSEDGFVLRVISSDQYETLTQQKRDMFGDSVGKKTYKSMTW